MSLDTYARFARTFLDANGRLPDAHADSRTERLAGQWLAEVRAMASAGSMTSEQIAMMDQVLPGWSQVPVQGIWLAQARKLADFVLEHRRCPELVTAAPHCQEHQLFLWANAHRLLRRAHRLNPVRHEWLDEHVPGWDGAFDDVAEVATAHLP